MFHAHIGGMDVCARALLIAEAMIRTAPWPSSWKTATPPGRPWAQDVLAGKSNLDAVANMALERNVDKAPASGRQEFLENWCNKFI